MEGGDQPLPGGDPEHERTDSNSENGTFWWYNNWLFFARCSVPYDSSDLLQQFVKERSAKNWNPSLLGD